MASELMNHVAARLVGKVQLTPDGLCRHPHAVEYAFGIDYRLPIADKKAWRVRALGTLLSGQLHR